MVSRVFLPGLFKWPRWELGNLSQFASFCTQAAAMTSPRSVEMKLGAKEPLVEEANRCELKLPMEIRRTACIRCGGHVPTGAITSRHHVKEERVSTPVRRSERIRSMKRKDYKEVSPEPKDYWGSDYSDAIARARGWPSEGRTMTYIIGKRCPRRRLSKALMAATTMTTAATITRRPWRRRLFRDAFVMLCSLLSLHHGALRIGRRVFPDHVGDEAAHG
jgi:hypothetical protein